MESSSLLKYARIAPRKVRIVAELIRAKPVDQAIIGVRKPPSVISRLRPRKGPLLLSVPS